MYFNLHSKKKMEEVVEQLVVQKVELMDYQRVAVDKFVKLFNRMCRMKGGLCFDEMGLGKTITALATLCEMIVAGTVRAPTLVLCPPNCVDGWKKEIETSFGGFDVRLFEGKISTFSDKPLTKNTIIIMSYAQLLTPFSAWIKKQTYELIVTNDSLLDRYCLMNQTVNRPDTRIVNGIPTQARKVIDQLRAGTIAPDDPSCALHIGDFSRSVEKFRDSLSKRYANKDASPDTDACGTYIFENDWGMLIVDEAQKVKAASSKTTKAVAMISSLFRLALTGTPVMNKAEELKNIMRYALHYGPGSGYDDVASVLYQECTIGRRKCDVRGLVEAPPNTYDVVCSVEGFPLLQQLYVDRLNLAQRGYEYLQQRHHFTGETDAMRALRLSVARRKFFSNISALQLVSLHPALLFDDGKSEKVSGAGGGEVSGEVGGADVGADENDIDNVVLERLPAFNFVWTYRTHTQFPGWFQERVMTFLLSMRRVAGYLTKDIHRMICTYWARQENELIQPSPKMMCIYDLYVRMLQRDPTDKMIVMSSSRRFLEKIVVPYFEQRKIGVVLFCGTTKKRKKAVLESFENDETIRVMCAVKSVAGVGLNLQSASGTVILCEPGWNEAIDAQAVARIDRKGQVRVPHIYRLLVSNSVDLAVRRLQAIKHTIATSTLYRHEEVQIATILRDLMDMNPETALVRPHPEFPITYNQKFLTLAPVNSPPASPFAVARHEKQGGEGEPPSKISRTDESELTECFANLTADELAYNTYYFKTAEEIMKENLDFV